VRPLPGNVCVVGQYRRTKGARMSYTQGGVEGHKTKASLKKAVKENPHEVLLLRHGSRIGNVARFTGASTALAEEWHKLSVVGPRPVSRAQVVRNDRVEQQGCSSSAPDQDLGGAGEQDPRPVRVIELASPPRFARPRSAKKPHAAPRWLLPPILSCERRARRPRRWLPVLQRRGRHIEPLPVTPKGARITPSTESGEHSCKRKEQYI
jgi:hypothetical protein